MLLAFLSLDCAEHRRPSERPPAASVGEALGFARQDYSARALSFDGYLALLDSLGTENPAIGKEFLQDDEEFERLLEKQVNRGEITVDQYRRYLETKLRFLQAYAKTRSASPPGLIP